MDFKDRFYDEVDTIHEEPGPLTCGDCDYFDRNPYGGDVGRCTRWDEWCLATDDGCE